MKYFLIFLVLVFIYSCSKEDEKLVAPTPATNSLFENQRLVLAGDTTGMNFTDVNPNLRITATPPIPAAYYVVRDSVDLDGDSVFDMIFVVFGENDLSSTPFVNYSIEENSFIEIAHESLNYIDTLNLNDTINSSLNWASPNFNTLHTFFYMDPSLSYGLWNRPSFDKYLAFRKISSSDTLYGWMNIENSQAFGLYGLYIKGYAIEN